MFEKVNPSHPDKIADRIAGAIVDLAYKKEENPKIAIEVIIGHGSCYIVGETSCDFLSSEISSIVHRIADGIENITLHFTKQDPILASNQNEKLRCGDNGIFKGMPITEEQDYLAKVVRTLYKKVPYDGKYVSDGNKLIICQSNIDTEEWRIADLIHYSKKIVNPLGDWTGGLDVDTGTTNRKLGSDMGDSVTDGGLHGKDLSKADVSVNIYAWLKAQETMRPQMFSCAIGDETIDGLPYKEIVKIARDFINLKGGFEKFAEWGLI